MTLPTKTVTLHLPYRLAKRGGRKEMLLPEGTPRRTDDALVKALARAFRWKRMLETGEVMTLTELAAREKIALSYVTRILHLAFLAPDIVQSIIPGKHRAEVTPARLSRPLPTEWDRQRAALAFESDSE